jgi:hypothetical protein
MLYNLRGFLHKEQTGRGETRCLRVRGGLNADVTPAASHGVTGASTEIRTEDASKCPRVTASATSVGNSVRYSRETNTGPSATQLLVDTNLTELQTIQ